MESTSDLETVQGSIPWLRLFVPLKPLPSEQRWHSNNGNKPKDIRSHPLILDIDNIPESALLLLLQQAQRTALLPQKQQETTALLHSLDIQELIHCLETIRYRQIVSFNPLIAANIVILLLSSRNDNSGSLATDFLLELCTVDELLPAIECMTTILKGSEPAADIIAQFIGRSIALQAMNRHPRMVRLFLAFLEMVLKQVPAAFVDIIPEVQAFCIEHSRIKEASTLYQHLALL